MIFPNQITTYIADKDLPWEYVWVEFDGLRVKSILDACGFSPNHPVYHAKSKDLREEMDERNDLYHAKSKFFSHPSYWSFIFVFGLFSPFPLPMHRSPAAAAYGTFIFTKPSTISNTTFKMILQ